MKDWKFFERCVLHISPERQWTNKLRVQNMFFPRPRTVETLLLALRVPACPHTCQTCVNSRSSIGALAVRQAMLMRVQLCHYSHCIIRDMK